MAQSNTVRAQIRVSVQATTARRETDSDVRMGCLRPCSHEHRVRCGGSDLNLGQLGSRRDWIGK